MRRPNMEPKREFSTSAVITGADNWNTQAGTFLKDKNRLHLEVKLEKVFGNELEWRKFLEKNNIDTSLSREEICMALMWKKIKIKVEVHGGLYTIRT